MKKIILILMAISLYGYDIVIHNGKVPSVDVKKIDSKFIKTNKIFEPYEKKFHNFSGITLKKFVELYSNGAKKVKFKAIDNYEISFDDKEINNENIIFTFKQDGEFIDFDSKGPARIIYINQDPSHIQKQNIKWIWMIVEADFR